MKRIGMMLPKKDAPDGLYLFCTKHISWHKNDSVIKRKCKSCELIYKAKVHIPREFLPGNKGKCRTKNFTAESFEKAVQLFMDFKQDLKKNKFQVFDLSEQISKPIFLLECMNEFMAFKRDENVEFHERKNLPKHNISTAQRYLDYFNFALIENKIKPDRLQFTDINNKIVGMVTEYLIGPQRNSSNRTFNNAIANIKSFMKYIIDMHYRDFESPFSKVKKLPVGKNNYVISKVEFMRVINRTKPENLVKISANSGRRKLLYRPWLIDGFYLGLFCGGRTEEPTNMKWSDIKLNSEGQMSFIRIVDLKRTRAATNIGKEVEVYKDVEMTPELEDVLKDLGYETKKGSQEYILAPDEPISRKTMAEKISEAFNFLILQLDLPEVKQFKNLRKTYATKCRIENPETFYMDMGHTNRNTTLNHYVDMTVVMEQRRKELYEQKKSNN